MVSCVMQRFVMRWLLRMCPKRNQRRWLYDQLASENRAQFFALAVEMTGGLSKEASLLIKTLIKEARFRHMWVPSNIVYGVKVRRKHNLITPLLGKPCTPRDSHDRGMKLWLIDLPA